MRRRNNSIPTRQARRFCIFSVPDVHLTPSQHTLMYPQWIILLMLSLLRSSTSRAATIQRNLSNTIAYC